MIKRASTWLNLYGCQAVQCKLKKGLTIYLFQLIWALLYDSFYFTNFSKSNFWRDFDIWLYCVAVVLLLHQSGFCPLCRKAPKIPKTCCSQTTEKSLTLFMAPILTLTARPLPAPDPSGTMSRNIFCWRSSLNFMLYYLLFHEI